MKLLTVLLSLLFPFFNGCGHPPTPTDPGNIFLRVRVLDPKAWTAGFHAEGPSMKRQGFLAYSLHRDMADPQSVIVTLKCSNLKKAVRYVTGGNLQDLPTVMGKQTYWAGVDVQGRDYSGTFAASPAGIVIVRHAVKDFNFWHEGFKHSSGGTHHHPDRKYKPANRSIHRVPGNPEAALVIHEASDVRKAPAFMETQNMRDRMEAGGVVGTPEIWYGTNLERGNF